MKENVKLVLLAAPLTVLVCYSWVFVIPYYSYFSEEDALSRAPGPIILGTLWAIGITIVSLLIVAKQYHAVHRGFALNDERSKMIVLRAGYYSFLLSIAWWILLNAVVISNTSAFGLPAREQASEALFGGLLALPVIFFLVWAYLTFLYRPDSR
jgi:hypothetical protein